MQIFEYEIEYSDAEEGKITHPVGIIAADSYGTAAERLSHFYGNGLEQINYLRIAEINNIYEFNNSEFGLFKFGSISLIQERGKDYIIQNKC
jgi:hypothetical protein